MITMVLGGLWHGASWHFVLWGLIHGLGLCVHKLRSEWPRSIEIPPAAALLLTQAWVFLAWIFFRVETLPDAAAGLCGRS